MTGRVLKAKMQVMEVRVVGCVSGTEQQACRDTMAAAHQ